MHVVRQAGRLAGYATCRLGSRASVRNSSALASMSQHYHIFMCASTTAAAAAAATGTGAWSAGGVAPSSRGGAQPSGGGVGQLLRESLLPPSGVGSGSGSGAGQEPASGTAVREGIIPHLSDVLPTDDAVSCAGGAGRGQQRVEAVSFLQTISGGVCM